MTAAEASAIKQRLIVALDLADPAKASTLATLLAPEVGMFKVGKQLFVNAGPNIVRTIHDLGGEVFLDLKFHDIPNTVAAAAVEAARLGVKLFNVHVSGGPEMMRQTAAAVEEVCEKESLRRPSVLGVTVLTSLDGSDLEALGIQGPVPAHVVRLARMAQEAGLAGVVCSAQEVPEIRRRLRRCLYAGHAGHPARGSAGRRSEAGHDSRATRCSPASTSSLWAGPSPAPTIRLRRPARWSPRWRGPWTETPGRSRSPVDVRRDHDH